MLLFKPVLQQWNGTNVTNTTNAANATDAGNSIAALGIPSFVVGLGDLQETLYNMSTL